MRKIISIVLVALTFASCSDSYLETEHYTKKTNATFYETPADISTALTACYSVLPLIGPSSNFFLTAELMSDDRFGGGGINDRGFLSTDAFKKSDENQYSDAWTKYYQGIFRCNMLLENINKPIIKWESEAQKNQAEGEARFLRAYFYFDLARMFGPVPLVLATEPNNIPRAAADAIYAQIATDLKQAISVFPKVAYSSANTANLGHATRWAAEGLMARVFLFYTGYYNKTELPVVEGTAVTKANVVEWIDECANSAVSGHDLISDFRNLWPYAYVNGDYDGKAEYPYAKKNGLKWVGETGANTETVFAMKFSTLGSWSTSIFYSNQTVLYFGLRDQTNVPFGQGWGAGTVNPQLWDSWDEKDIRKRGSIMNVSDADENMSGYKNNGWEQMHETGLWQKKYMPVNKHVLGKDGKYAVQNYSTELYGMAANYQLDNTQDLVVIRFADILLMGAELGSTKAAEYLHRVRSRVGLPDVAVTLDNIKKERRYELAFEGVRYHDLLRWHDAEAAFSAVKNVPVRNNGVAGQMYSATFRPETGGFLPVPNKEVILSSGVLTQTPGWTDASSNY